MRFCAVTRRTELPALYTKYRLYGMADAGGGVVWKFQFPRLCTVHCTVEFENYRLQYAMSRSSLEVVSSFVVNVWAFDEPDTRGTLDVPYSFGLSAVHQLNPEFYWRIFEKHQEETDSPSRGSQQTK